MRSMALAIAFGVSGLPMDRDHHLFLCFFVVFVIEKSFRLFRVRHYTEPTKKSDKAITAQRHK